MTFGQSASLFNDTRQAYAVSVIARVVQIVGQEPGARVLDIGCGTGIATRQLAERGVNVIGADSDTDMIRQARLVADGQPPEFLLMRADSLAFDDGSFDAVTAFGAFHWFANAASIAELRRVLRPGGHLVVVNKRDAGSFADDIVRIVARHVPLAVASPKTGYDPAALMEAHRFIDVSSHAVVSTESLSAPQAVAHARSLRLWEDVPPALYRTIENDLSDYVSARLGAAGRLVRDLTTVVVSGRKPADIG